LTENRCALFLERSLCLVALLDEKPLCTFPGALTLLGSPEFCRAKAPDKFRDTEEDTFFGKRGLPCRARYRKTAPHFSRQAL
jgi:hypothetical protein